ncbi:MAG: hypothetical protein LCH61_11900 [Proteobacteria bacterium]|nr:hypothetical protein [Pseudomonadota bacterium]
MSFPKKGRVLPVAADGTGPFAALIAVTLRQSLGDRPSAIKVVARWTGAGERTVKNWFAGKSGPNGDHLMDLVRNCPDVLDAFLIAAGRSDRIAASNVREARMALIAALHTLDKFSEEHG